MGKRGKQIHNKNREMVMQQQSRLILLMSSMVDKLFKDHPDLAKSNPGLALAKIAGPSLRRAKLPIFHMDNFLPPGDCTCNNEDYIRKAEKEGRVPCVVHFPDPTLAVSIHKAYMDATVKILNEEARKAVAQSKTEAPSSVRISSGAPTT
jgi:hypothetical protein